MVGPWGIWGMSSVSGDIHMNTCINCQCVRSIKIPKATVYMLALDIF